MVAPKRSLRLASLLIAAGVLVVVGVVYVAAPQLLYQAELMVYDQHLRARGVRVGNEQVLIVAIDEPSLREIGRWPWSRTVLADLVQRLTEAGAAAVGVDIILSEPEVSPEAQVARRLLERVGPGAGPEIRRDLQRIVREADPDRRLATVLRRSGRVVLAMYFGLAPRPSPAAPEPDGDAFKSALSSFRSFEQRGVFAPPHAAAVNMPIPELADAAAGLAHINIIADVDGSTRWEALVVEHRGHYYPSLAVETVRIAAGLDPFQLKLDFGFGFEVADVFIPIDGLARVLIDYPGPGRTFRHVSAADILRGRVDPSELRDRIVFVGATAEGLYDVRVTPFSAVYPGVEKHATIAANILEQRFLVRPAWVETVEIAGIVLFVAVLGLLLPYLRPTWSVVATLTLAAAFVGVIHLAFRAGLWLLIIYPALAGGLTFVGITVYRFFAEERQRLWTRRAFQQYVSPEVVERIMENPDGLKFGGELRNLTVLFSDIRSFTTFTESHDPHEVVQMLREYLTRMTDCVLRERGTLDKYIGDAVMAIFGAPVALPDHAERACRAALAMVSEMDQLRERWLAEGREPFRIGIGINTDDLVVGNLGSEQLFDYTVIGDGVNLGARLESLNKEYKTERAIIISEATYEAASEAIEARRLGEVVVKGKTRPVQIYELLGLKGEGNGAAPPGGPGP